ncbi:MAG: pseudouridine synthase, partial [bacterium]|nr:pseudouridine synthase [bacterium]
VDNFVDNLVKDGKSHMARVAKAGEREAKRAELSYCVLAETEREGRPVGLAEVELKTGRYHQIRAQFAAHGLPLYGDGKYGGWGQPLALFAYRLSLVHPKSGQPLHFLELPKSEAFAGFEEVLERLTL